MCVKAKTKHIHHAYKKIQGLCTFILQSQTKVICPIFGGPPVEAAPTKLPIWVTFSPAALGALYPFNFVNRWPNFLAIQGYFFWAIKSPALNFM